MSESTPPPVAAQGRPPTLEQRNIELARENTTLKSRLAAAERQACTFEKRTTCSFAPSSTAPKSLLLNVQARGNVVYRGNSSTEPALFNCATPCRIRSAAWAIAPKMCECPQEGICLGMVSAGQRCAIGATPRCDQEEYTAIANTNSALMANDKQYVVPADFARKLEREIAEQTEAADASAKECDRLQAELAEWRAQGYVPVSKRDAVTPPEAATKFTEAALRFARAHVESDRLDRMDDDGGVADAVYDAATAEYNASKAALVAAYKVQRSGPSQQT